MMVIPRSIPTVLGALAVFATAALVAVHAILARELVSAEATSIRTIAIVSSALEGVVFLVLSAHLIFHLRRTTASKAASATGPSQKQQRTPNTGLLFGLSIFLCTAAAGVSVATLVSLGKTAHSLPDTIFGTGVVSFLAGAAVTLGVCYVSQLLFLVAYLITARAPLAGGLNEALRTSQHSYGQHSVNVTTGGTNSRSSSRPTSARVKSIPYSQTTSPGSTSFVSRKEKVAAARGGSVEFHTPPGSSGGRSAAETMSSLRSSFSHAVRPISSKTRLIASGSASSRSSQHQPASSTCSPASSSSVEDGFDSWDTSAVDPHNRQTVMETSTSPIVGGRFLETIPASPTTSRSPSPGTPLDLEPPHNRRRSRSYSPGASSMRAARPRARSQSHSQSSTDEAHIHPLFRSDSPTPPPAVSAGTVVTAAPNAGQVINYPSDSTSRRTIGRMRSGSLPAVSSPLSRQSSFDDFASKRGGTPTGIERPHTGVASSSSAELREEEEESSDGEDNGKASLQNNAERKMTPPIPEWILSAGSRTSLSGYESRKVRVEDGAPRKGVC